MNSIVIQNQPLAIKEYNGQRVVTFKDVDTLHKRPDGTAKRNFAENRRYFIEGEDFFKLSYEEARSTNFVPRPNSQGLILITKSGYPMLAKSFSDELSWAVQRELVNGYFGNKKPPASQFDLMRTMIDKIEEQSNQIQVMNHRINNLDGVSLEGDTRQQLVKMVRLYAREKGVNYGKAWTNFKQFFNTAYHTNLELIKSNQIQLTGNKITLPELLESKGWLEDGIRIADKMLNEDY